MLGGFLCNQTLVGAAGLVMLAANLLVLSGVGLPKKGKNQ